MKGEIAKLSKRIMVPIAANCASIAMPSRIRYAVEGLNAKPIRPIPVLTMMATNILEPIGPTFAD